MKVTTSPSDLSSLRALRQATTPPEHDQAVQWAEERLGRRLSEAEQRIDLVAQARDLKNGKRLLLEAVVQEQARAVREAVASGNPIRLEVSTDMRRVLSHLYDAGVEHATQELKAAGVDVGD